MIEKEQEFLKSRLLVVLEPHVEAERLLRSALRRAERDNLDCEVLLIETPGFYNRLTRSDRDLLFQLASQAEQKGAIITHCPHAKSMVQGVAAILKERLAQNIEVTAIKVGILPPKNYWSKLFDWKPSLYKKLLRKFGNQVPILSVPLGFDNIKPIGIIHFFYLKKNEALFSLFLVAFATLFIQLSQLLAPDLFGFHNRNKTMIYLIACMIAAGRNGFLAGLIASAASFFTLSMLYIAPYYSLKIEDISDAMSLSLFIIAGLIVSLIGNRDYGSRLSLTNRANRFHSLLKVHRMALNKNSVEEAIATLDEEVKKLLGTDVVFWTPSVIDKNTLETFYRKDGQYFLKDIQLNNAERKALAACWETSKIAGIGTSLHSKECKWRFEPLLTAKGEVGVLGILVNDTVEIDEDFNRLTSGIADQVALILERLQFEKTMENTKIQSEKEKLRAMLLSSVSHDLKTPLASVIGSLSVFRSMASQLSEEHSNTLINTALEEAQRLDSFITNILDITRIESGQIELKSEWINPNFLINEVAQRLRNRLANHPLVTYAPADNAWEVSMDVMMTGQVIQNLLDNAAKYTPLGTQIEIAWEFSDANGFELRVQDYGTGIPQENLSNVFDKYSRIKKQDTQVAGTGLGLAIAKAVMNAQAGDITASNHPAGGAVFTLRLPHIRRQNAFQAA